jgi:hypothetical protein
MEHYFREHPVELVHLLAGSYPDRADYFRLYAMNVIPPPSVHRCPKCGVVCFDLLSALSHYYVAHVSWEFVIEKFWRDGRCAFCGASEQNILQHLVGHHPEQLQAVTTEKFQCGSKDGRSFKSDRSKTESQDKPALSEMKSEKEKPANDVIPEKSSFVVQATSEILPPIDESREKQETVQKVTHKSKRGSSTRRGPPRQRQLAPPHVDKSKPKLLSITKRNSNAATRQEDRPNTEHANTAEMAGMKDGDGEEEERVGNKVGSTEDPHFSGSDKNDTEMEKPPPVVDLPDPSKQLATAGSLPGQSPRNSPPNKPPTSVEQSRMEISKQGDSETLVQVKLPQGSSGNESAKLAVTQPGKPLSNESGKALGNERTKPEGSQPTKPPVNEPTTLVMTQPTKPPLIEASKLRIAQPTKPPASDPSKLIMTQPTQPPGNESAKPLGNEPTKPEGSHPTKPPLIEASKLCIAQPTNPPGNEPTNPPASEPGKLSESGHSHPNSLPKGQPGNELNPQAVIALPEEWHPPQKPPVNIVSEPAIPVSVRGQLPLDPPIKSNTSAPTELPLTGSNSLTVKGISFAVRTPEKKVPDPPPQPSTDPSKLGLLANPSLQLGSFALKIAPPPGGGAAESQSFLPQPEVEQAGILLRVSKI